jgi:hypothetical protein
MRINQPPLFSGAVVSGFIGNAAVLSGSIGSGQIGLIHVASGVIQSGITLTSGSVVSGFIGNNAVNSGNISSGTIGSIHIYNGSINSGNIGSGQIGSIHIAPEVLNNISGNLNILSGNITANTIVINSAIFSGLTSTTTVYSGNISLGMAAYFDYAAKNTLKNSYRAGTITTIWDASSETIAYNDVSTQDLGGETTDLSFSTHVISGNLQLNAQITSGSFNLKIGAKFI